MTWVVVTKDAYERFCAENPEDHELQYQVTAWALLLQVTGPPEGGEFDRLRDTWTARIPGTSVDAEYLILPDLDPPVIVVREYRRR